MENKILELIEKSKKHYLSLNEIIGKLNEEDTNAVIKTVIKLEESGLLFYDDEKQVFMDPKFHNILKMSLQMNKRGFAFGLADDEEDVFIAKKDLNQGCHNDIVWVKIIKNNENKRREGKVLKIIERRIKKVVGEFVRLKRKDGKVIPFESKFNLPIIIPQSSCQNCVDGHNVIAVITKYEEKYLEGKIVEIIGHKNDPGIDILTVLRAHEIKTEFDAKTLKQANLIEEKISEEERSKRKDLTKQIIITIDGDDAKDLDDAISIRKTGLGYMLGVHIADVSYYVQENSYLDQEAFERGTSVYVVDRVIPMLPHILSNGICSLNPQVERLAISCEMDFDLDGNLLDYRIFPSIIKSKERMTYNNVNKILENEDEKLKKKYRHIVKELKIMKELSLILRAKREVRGAIDFETNEAKIVVDENGKAIDVVLRNRKVSEKMIEDFMIAANECVASHFHALDIPFIYRIHENPEVKKLREFSHIASLFNLKIKGSLEDVKPKVLQNLIRESKEIEEAKSIPTLLLRCMKKAVYDTNCVGHYGLASTDYTHFTSPIRRYPDLIVHRLIRKYHFENDLKFDTIKYNQDLLPKIALHSSEKERSAIEAERDVDDMKKAEYMESFIGEVFEGRISSVTNFGFFVELENTIEGLVSIVSLPDYFIFDQSHLRLVGEQTKITYQIGDLVKVKLVKADKREGQIDFEIVGGKNEKILTKHNSNIRTNIMPYDSHQSKYRKRGRKSR